jgi:HTTM domain
MSALRGIGRRALDVWFAPVPAERLRLFQRVFTATFLVFFVAWAMHASEWLTTRGLHLSAAARHPVQPESFPLLPEAWVAPFVVLVVLLALAVVLDVGGRPLKVALLLAAIYIEMVDDLACYTLNRFYIVGFLTMVMASPPRRVDGEPMQSAWPVRVLQTTLIVVYCTAGLCKIFHGDWLARPDILLSHSVGYYRTPLAGWMSAHLPYLTWTVLGLGALLFELGAPLWFGIKRLRPFGYVAGIAFHLSIALLMKDLIYFSAQMVTFYLLFIEADRAVIWERAIAGGLRRSVRRLGGFAPAPDPVWR